jgi:4-amino-4-deoxy-L-arabinose transferase-like glycosyltransferase
MSCLADGKKRVVTLLCLAFVLRLGVWLAAASDPMSRYMVPDSYSYWALADQLLEFGRFGDGRQAEIFRVPGYPLLLVPFVAMGAGPAVVCLFQVLLDTATCLLVWRLGCRAFGARAGLGALLFQAVSVVSIVYACRLLSETVFTFTLVLVLNLVFDLTCRPQAVGAGKSRIAAGLVGMLLGAMAYLRAVALPLSILPLFLLWHKRGWRHALLAGLVLITTIAPWVIRNRHQADFTGFSSVSAVLLYRYNACMLLADRAGSSFAEQQALIDAELAELESQTAVARYTARRGLNVIFAHPVRYAWLHLLTVPTNLLPATGELLETFGVELSPGGTLAVLRSRGLVAGVKHYFGGKWGWFWLGLPPVLVLVLIYALAAAGIWRAWGVRTYPGFVVLLLLILGFFLLVPSAAAHPRFRVPVMPIINILAGFGWAARPWYPRRAKAIENDPENSMGMDTR